MRGNSVVVWAVGLLVVMTPRALAAQPGTSTDTWPRLSVHVAAGAMLPHGDERGGELQSASIGYAPTPKLMVLVSGSRMHTPTRIDRFPDGVSSATRGGTTLFASGEARFVFAVDGVSPYAVAGAGVGQSRPNVNDLFPDPVTNVAIVWFGGGGLAVPLGPHLRVFAELSLFLLGERDVIRFRLPLRGGVAWHF